MKYSLSFYAHNFQGGNGGFSGLIIPKKSRKSRKNPENPKIHQSFLLVNEGISS
jgi:hypothetical protein